MHFLLASIETRKQKFEKHMGNDGFDLLAWSQLMSYIIWR